MSVWMIVLICLIMFVFLDAKTSRSDGVYIPSTHPYRKLMPFVMKKRNESIVFFDLDIPAQNLAEFLKEREGVGITQCMVAAISHILHTHPSLNRFVSGGRLYQRNDVVISFSMKRKKMGAESKIAVVKQIVQSEDSFSVLCTKIESKVRIERSETTTFADKEFSLLTKIPRFILRLGVLFVQLLDDFNILPKSFIDNDGLYCSVFVANVGSLGMPAGYHHLYEWGNCPIFITVGAIEKRVVSIEEGREEQDIIPMRIAFDERINDALGVKNAVESLQKILSDPQTFFTD